MKSSVGKDKVVHSDKRGTESRTKDVLVVPPKKKLKVVSSPKTSLEHTKDYLATASEKELDKLAKWLNRRRKSRARPQDSKQQVTHETSIPSADQPVPDASTTPRIIRDITVRDVDQMRAALFPETVVPAVPRKQKLGDR